MTNTFLMQDEQPQAPKQETGSETPDTGTEAPKPETETPKTGSEEGKEEDKKEG